MFPQCLQKCSMYNPNECLIADLAMQLSLGKTRPPVAEDLPIEVPSNHDFWVMSFGRCRLGRHS